SSTTATNRSSRSPRRATTRRFASDLARRSDRAGAPCSCRRVLLIEAAQHVEELGLARLQRDRDVEEGLGRDGEELARILATVRVGPPTAVAPPQRCERLGTDVDPTLQLGAILQPRRSVDEMVDHVELVRELVKHDVATAPRVARGFFDLVPRQHDWTAPFV